MIKQQVKGDLYLLTLFCYKAQHAKYEYKMEAQHTWIETNVILKSVIG